MPPERHSKPSNLAALQERIESLQQERRDRLLESAHTARLATLGTLASLIAHEFNNILTPVLSYAQLALADRDNSELAQKALQKAMDGSSQAAEIARAILGFCRLDEAQDRQASVAEVLGAALLCLARPPERDGIEFGAEIDPDLPDADIQPVSLQHVLLNLLLNARRAMLPQGGSLRVRAFRTAERPLPPAGATCSRELSTWNDSAGNDWIVLEITDSGRGMDEEQIGQLFRPFFTRSGPRGPGGQPGTGLGMTACATLVHEVGGCLFATSRPGKGTVITVVLRAVRAEQMKNVA